MCFFFFPATSRQEEKPKEIKMKRKKILITIALMSFMGLMSHADPVTYTFSGTGSGDVGGVLFNNEAFSIAVSADTASIVNPVAGVYFVNDIPDNRTRSPTPFIRIERPSFPTFTIL